MDSTYARDGDSIGTPMFRSPEAHLQMRWGTATDIWSFGATASFELSLYIELFHLGLILLLLQLISLMYGEGFHIFRPDVSVDHDEYEVKILMRHHICFGPFPESYEQIADQERLAVLVWIMHPSGVDEAFPSHNHTRNLQRG
jgi:serine/threonine protein kinase